MVRGQQKEEKGQRGSGQNSVGTAMHKPRHWSFLSRGMTTTGLSRVGHIRTSLQRPTTYCERCRLPGPGVPSPHLGLGRGFLSKSHCQEGGQSSCGKPACWEDRKEERGTLCVEFTERSSALALTFSASEFPVCGHGYSC